MSITVIISYFVCGSQCCRHILDQTPYAVHPDLRHLMDNDYFMLIPDRDTISFVDRKIPLESTERLKHPIDHFYTTKVFKYHIVPLRPMHDIQITRIVKDTEGDLSSSQFISHSYPYTTVGTLESHVYPHYVLFNAGEKVSKLMLKLDYSIFRDWIEIIFVRCLGVESESFAETLAEGYAVEVRAMYTRWSRSPRLSLSDYIHRSYAPTISSGTWPNGNGGSNHKIQSLNRSLEGSSRYISGIDGAKVPECYDDIDSDDEDQQAYDFTKSKKVVLKWWEETTEAVAQQGGWDSNLVNDEQIGPYIDERPRCPPLEPWSTWRPTWPRVYIDMPPDTRKFSSNDWAYKEEFVLLTELRDFDDDTSS